MDSTTIGVAAGTVTAVNLVTAVNTYAGTVGTAPIGSTVEGVYLFFQIQPQAAQGQVDALIWKRATGTVTSPTPGATGGNPARRFILHEEKGIPGTFNNGASPLTYRGFIRLPPRIKRMGEDDLIQIRVSCSTAYDFCLKAIYKWKT